jgi:RNA polymerase sigma-70 factor (ECF subfamily)
MSTVGTPATVLATKAAEETAAPADRLARAFSEIRDDLVSTLCFILGNREDAQDTAQEAFLKCWRAQESLGAVRDLRAWIYRVALNAAKDLQRSAWRRRAKLLQGDEAMLMGSDLAPGQALEDRESLERLRRAILELRADEKEVFLLRQNGDLTYEQIAEMRHAPVGTVKTQMRSALQKLRQQMAT